MMLGFVFGLLNLRSWDEDGIAAKYGGCAWCDSTEQQIIRDVTRS
jgi:hypothetical protein